MAVATFEGLPTGATTAAAAGFDFISAPSGGGAQVISTSPYRGTRCLQLTTGSAGAICYAERSTSLGASSTGSLYGRCRVRLPSLPGDTTGMRVMVVTDSPGAFLGDIRVINSGKIQLRSGSGTVLATSTMTLTANTWVDVGIAVLVFSSTVGQLQMQIWNTDGSVAETWTSTANLNTLGSGGSNKAQVGAIRSGVNLFSVVVDDVDWSTSGYPTIIEVGSATASGNTASSSDTSGAAALTAVGATTSGGAATSASAGTLAADSSSTATTTVRAPAAVTAGSTSTATTAAAAAQTLAVASSTTGTTAIGAATTVTGSSGTSAAVTGGQAGSSTVTATTLGVAATTVRAATRPVGDTTSAGTVTTRARAAAAGTTGATRTIVVAASVTASGAQASTAATAVQTVASDIHATVAVFASTVAAAVDITGGTPAVTDVEDIAAVTGAAELLSAGAVSGGGHLPTVRVAAHRARDTTRTATARQTGVAATARRTR